MNLLELLEAGNVEEFNAKRGVRRPPDLFAADLSNKNLRDADLSGANLEKADLSGSDLTGALLERCNLSGADLTGAILTGVRGIKVRCKEAWFEDVALDGADFTGGDFREAVLNGAKGAGAILSGVRLSGAEVKDADLSGADLTEARLANADFSGTRLNNALLARATMGGTEFTQATLVDADLSGARATGVKLNHTDLSGAVLREADLTEADLGGARMPRADLTRADLARASLQGADLNEAIFVHARLDEVELTEEQKAVIVTDSDEVEDSAGELVFHDLQIDAVEGTVGITWENETAAGGLSLLGAVFGPSGHVEEGPVRLPVPLEMVLAHGMAATSEGYVALCFMERPSGMTLMVSEISPMGDLGGTRTLDFDYRPAVTPVIVSDGDGVLIYGLSRRGPTLFVHRYTSAGLERLWGEACPTARGFVGVNPPLLVTKGGTLLPVGKEGLGKAVSCPEGFPGRHASCCIDEEGIHVAWLKSGVQGFFFATLVPGERAEVDHLLKQREIAQLEMINTEEGPLALFTSEQGGEMSPVACYGVELPAGVRPFPILEDADVDVERVLPFKSDGVLRVACQTMDDAVVVMDVASGKSKRWGQFP
ncbi:MAG: pentapeptide repeat-containing protein [Myxococcota bacterium]|nr:pentapeptide repeat-containing protein [Myxococcota bacterium]